MPQEPKKRHSKARQGKRRAKIALTLPTLVTCQNCKSKILPHTICRYCGFYKGRQVLPPKADRKKGKNEKKE